jgi:hypothetical protein
MHQNEITNTLVEIVRYTGKRKTPEFLSIKKQDMVWMAQVFPNLISLYMKPTTVKPQ